MTEAHYWVLVFYIFALAVAAGVELISKVPPLLHTPLMSGSNAISGITLVGAILAAVYASWDFKGVLAFLGVTLATINVVGGYAVTDRMLQMFKKKK
ncbi:MAG TPA: NAD(P) transhydrogenase subunit alpha [Planctomycetota bacterium]|jgi:NAD(P) transhydrogenase subunit alpha|nr:NAD(P) transhydrogenase subunit alpha [Planctomycetota bacterium]